MNEETSLPVAWEAAKENIQPLRRGRNITLLTEALTMDPEMLEEKKGEFEEALRAYEGDDPLEIWDSYLTWLEEHYPSGLHGLHLPQLLENCISAFISEPDHKYDNDPRFVRVWLKFASLQVHPEEVYKCMSARGVGVGSAAFYVEWANFHELSGEPRVAQEILEKGVQMLAQPLEQLHAALKELILRLAQGSTRPQEDNSYQVGENEETRSAFSRLRIAPGRAANAPVIRVGSNRLAHNPGLIQQTTSLSSVRPAANETMKSCAQTRISVFMDETNPAMPPSSAGDSLFTGMGTLSGSVSRSHKLVSEKENSRKAGKWTKEKIRQRVIPREAPAFEIVRDDDVECGASSAIGTPAKSRPPVFLGSGLSARKAITTEMSLSHILGKSDSPNINEKRMYDFLAVYAGTTEFQFEEIRLVRFKKQRKDAESKPTPSIVHKLNSEDGFAPADTQLAFHEGCRLNKALPASAVGYPKTDRNNEHILKSGGPHEPVPFCKDLSEKGKSAEITHEIANPLTDAAPAQDESLVCTNTPSVAIVPLNEHIQTTRKIKGPGAESAFSSFYD
ncbi:mitotic checkpoint serine/threonine-protein kinase BUB1 beta-like [Tropilaelaps mercedesae]|uniref:Mitotic checkpoint serine/threonine-protein kinase BUB1 beta-like n=1 Tax=Tropilaelaps mercedesae TaxID=418985 RepID=A0A1V9XTU1_9ACAR|nr:mitotic checkpoint serine/threonine-protein kinase BUB1 beta-like [Tropilaelaps mercedesae]